MAARGPKIWTEELIEKRQKDGYGQGNAENYKAWIKFSDFSSKGLVSRIWSPKFKRKFYVLSQAEEHLFYVLEWAKDIVEIREQYPLDRDITRELAAARKIPHPSFPKTTVPFVMTVDFLVTKMQPSGPILVPLSCKYQNDVEDEEEINKHEIMRAYFSGMQCELKFVVAETLPETLISNLTWIRGGHLSEDEIEPYPNYFLENKQRMTNILGNQSRDLSLVEFCNWYENQFNLDPGDALRVAKMLMYDRTLLVDVNMPNLASAPLSVFKLSDSHLSRSGKEAKRYAY